MGKCLQYKFPCGCEVWKGLDCNGETYIEYIEDDCRLAKAQAEVERLRKQVFVTIKPRPARISTVDLGEEQE